VYEASDSSLMQAVREGDLGGLAVLFERHHRPLFNYFVHVNGNRDLSEDLVQEVFFRMLKYRRTYQPERPFTAWMYQIARNANVDSIGKRKFEVGLGDREFASTNTMEENLKHKQEVALLKTAMARLPLEKRELLVLSRYQNLKYEEIAGILGCDIGAVKVRVYRAVRALGQIYFELAGERAS
jgi:RNA polymerase sigma-70 factor (ECF subfamily)